MQKKLGTVLQPHQGTGKVAAPETFRDKSRGLSAVNKSGRETIARGTGGMKVKADRDEASPYAAMLAAQDVAEKCKSLGITALQIKLCATGGNKTKTPGK
ncbi:hypothetical protein KR054_005705 [Drosophila jambulina]|nr:hypothetical protein KR054_005705 [Drosophila jambulina]